MPGQQVVDAQAVGGVADAVVEEDQAAEAGAVRVPVDLAQPAFEPVPEVIGAEVVEPGAVDGGGDHGAHAQLGGDLLAEGQRPPLVIAEDRLGQVLDADLLGAHPRTEKPPSTTRVWPVT